LLRGQAVLLQTDRQDVDGDTLRFSITNKPGWLSLT
jgi:hypothetical protein